MAQIAFRPRVRVITHSDEPISSTETAAEFVECCSDGDFDFEAEIIRQQLLNANKPTAAAAAERVGFLRSRRNGNGSAPTGRNSPAEVSSSLLLRYPTLG
jgi:hypothetical protein